MSRKEGQRIWKTFRKKATRIATKAEGPGTETGRSRTKRQGATAEQTAGERRESRSRRTRRSTTGS